MKIFLTGGAHDTASLLQALGRADGNQITHCADGVRAIAELLKQGCDWAIVNSRAVSGGEKDIARLIRAVGTHLHGVHPLTAPCAGAVAAHSDASHACGVEWTNDGVLQLHCRQHALIKESMSPGRPHPGCAGEILFEYHAPCIKARRRNG